MVPRDKFLHQKVSESLAAFINAAIGKQHSNLGPIVAAFIGAVKEVVDWPGPGNASIGDGVADAAGVLAFFNLKIKLFNNSIEVIPVVTANSVAFTVGGEF